MMGAKRLWVPVAAALLVAALIGPGMVAGAEPKALVTRGLMVSGVAAIALDDDTEYENSSGMLESSTGAAFAIPLSFPVPQVTIKRITLYAYDNDPGYGVYVYLRRTAPPLAGMRDLASLATSGSSTEFTQTLTTTAIFPRTVNTANFGLHLEISLSGDTRFYGAQVIYSYEP